MGTDRMGDVVRRLGRAEDVRTDRELLDRYLAGRDEAALAALVGRHGPMVWGVCRRIVRDRHDAEDAFQATFLVLVRRAGAIRSRELVANWLHGVARRTALKARARAAGRGRRERTGADPPEPAARAAADPDVGPVVDAEVARLPDVYRAVVVLCDLEGRTRADAARHLGVPVGTVAGRLARARALLARRLGRHGLPAAGGVPAGLIASTAAAVADPPAAVAALTEGVLPTMRPTKLLIVAAAVAGAALVAWGAGRPPPPPPPPAGYVPPEFVGPEFVSEAVELEVALDAAGGRDRPYFLYPPDPLNVNHRWELRPAGDHVLIVSRVGDLALDADGGSGSPRLREPDPTNPNHLWRLRPAGECVLLVPKAADVALDANGSRGNPHLRPPDPSNVNHLWYARKTDDGSYLLVPKVRRPVVVVERKAPAARPGVPPVWRLDGGRDR